MPPNASKASPQATLDAAYAAAEGQSVSFLLFSLGGELYGAPLLSAREVIKPGDIKPVPYMLPHFRGVINLRGRIVSVVDLRVKFGIEPAPGRALVLIVETPEGPLGAIVDDLTGVEKLPREQIDETAALETRIPLDFFLGVAKVRDRLVNVVDIAACLSAEDFRILKQA